VNHASTASGQPAVSNPDANPPGLDGEPASVRDAYDARTSGGKK